MSITSFSQLPFLRAMFLRMRYWHTKLRNKHVVFNGFTICYAFKDSKITFKQGKRTTTINSSFYSNLLGLYQRSIIVARYGGEIEIGEGCGISGSTIYAMQKIHIGNNVLIGGNCKIIDNDFHPLSSEKRINQKEEDIKKRAIFIGDDCFIGANSIILKGTTLGRNCIVGAGSVVSGTFPDNVILAGNPAKIIKEDKTA